MDDLGKMLGGLTGGPGSTSGSGGTGGTGDIAGAVGGLVDGEGGLDGLLGQLRQGGLGDQVDSWVGTGPNQPVDPQQLGSALGPDRVNQAASSTGFDVASLLPMLASFLPTVINALTPDGKVPAGGAGGGFDLGSILSGLGGGGSAAAGGARARPGTADGSVGDIGKILGDR